MKKYARVAVDMSRRQKMKLIFSAESDGEEIPVLRTFHYRIPASLRDRVAVGQLVWVPFGRQRAQGIIVGFDTSSPIADAAIKDLIKLADPQPMLTPAQIDLAYWMSRYYLAPLFDTLLLMLPSGVTQGTQTFISLANSKKHPYTPDQHAIVALLQEVDEFSTREIEEMLGKRKSRAAIRQLLDLEIISKRVEELKPRARPKYVRFAQLIASAEEIAAELAGRSKKRAAVVSYLQTHRAATVSDIYAATGANSTNIKNLEERGLIRTYEREVRRDPLAEHEIPHTVAPELTPDQRAAWDKIAAAITAESSEVFLLHGVTGSGKTEIYLRGAQEVLTRDKQAIIMVPEISLTPQTVNRFVGRFGDRVAVLHSRLSVGERYDEWRRVRDGKAAVVVGPRSALFAPCANPGLIVLDEEHDSSYKQDAIPTYQVPHYNTRDAAVEYAKLTGAVVVLGSATPNVTTYYRATSMPLTPALSPKGRGSLSPSPPRGEGLGVRGEYTLLELPKRIVGYDDAAEVRYAEMPPIQVVDLRQELRDGNRSIFSRALQTAMHGALANGEQVLLFLNRRGTSTFILCRDCGCVLKCHRCDVPLTYHEQIDTGEIEPELRCHHCNWRYEIPTRCPECGSHRIKYFGAGTERIEAEVQRQFPQARTTRWDWDTTRRKDAHARLMSALANHEIDVVIGTQMIAKGLDLPLVTVVGVVSADTALHLPDFRTGERTFQLITQVAGRAGRSPRGGRVIVQSYSPEHYAIRAASKYDYAGFYRHELGFRREVGYPPFSRLAKLVYQKSNLRKCQDEAERLGEMLRGKIARLGIPNTNLIGPAPAFFSRVRGKYRWQIVIRGVNPHELLGGIPLPWGWEVDVDPVSLL